MNPYISNVLAVVNQKGGAGKTTVASIIAEYAALIKHYRVLVIDLDMQCNQTDYWIGMEIAPNSEGGQLPPIHPDYDGDEDVNERSTIVDQFYGKYILPYSTYICEENGYKGKVDIIAGHPAELEHINTFFKGNNGRIDEDFLNRIQEFLHNEDIAGSYDLIVLDTAPSRNPIFRSALRAATHIVIPFEPEEKSLQGVNAMFHSLQSENNSRKDGDEAKLIGVLPNKVNLRLNLHNEIINVVKESLSEYLLEDYLPDSVAFPERDVTSTMPKSIFSIRQSHKARIHAENVCEIILDGIFKKETVEVI